MGHAPFRWHALLLRIARIPEAFWAPLMSGALILLAGFLSFLLGHPWLFPSLGPTALIQAHRPASHAARIYNTLTGHFLGLIFGWACVWVTGAGAAPTVAVTDHVVLIRVVASALAVALTMLGQVLLRAYHPPAAATTLIITLGLIRAARDTLGLAMGLLLVALAGEFLRHLRILARRR